MIAGRFILGAGREAYFIAQNKFLTKWFKGKELAFAFGLPLGFSRATAALNSSVSPWLMS